MTLPPSTRAALAGAALLLAAPAPPGATISAAEVRAHVALLASDELAGRGAGRTGADLAAAWVARRFDACGLRPLPAGWRLPFPVRGVAGEALARVSLAGRTSLDGPELRVLSFSGTGSVRAPLASADAELAGRIALAPAQADARGQAAGLLERGAAAVVLLSDAPRLEPLPPPPSVQIIGEAELEEELARMDEATRAAVLATIRLGGPVVLVAGRLREALLEQAAAGGALSVEVARRGRDRSCNVVGVLDGSDPALRDEYVIVGAHYDHLGTDARGDVFHGADDNASGTAAVLEIAQALAGLALRPRRTILLVAWGAEERGMIGSRAFCKDPPVPLERVAAVINLDMIGRNDPRAVAVLAAGDDLRAVAVTAAELHGFEWTAGDPLYLGATDSAPFVHREVPTVSFSSGTHEDYNTPRDTVERLDVDKVARVARAALDVALEVANGDARPAFDAPNGGTPR